MRVTTRRSETLWIVDPGAIAERSNRTSARRWSSSAIWPVRPANIDRPAELTADADRARQDMRLRASERFLAKRRTAQTEAYTHSYDQAAGLMQKKALFDSGNEPEKHRERYGQHDFGRHCPLRGEFPVPEKGRRAPGQVQRNRRTQSICRSPHQ